MGERFDPIIIVSSFRGMVSVRLIVEGTIIVITHFIAAFMLNVVSLLASVFNPLMCIFVMDNVAQIHVVSLSTALLWGSVTAGRVPAWALAVVRILTPSSNSMLNGWVNHSSCIQHCLEVFDLCIYLLDVFRQQGGNLINDHP
jgi:hypothetical protein